MPSPTLPTTPLAAQALIDLLREPLATRVPVLAPERGRPAAVLILVYDLNETAHIVLTKRSAELSSHGGQISLPGGRPEAEDSDLAATALRETSEEVGVPPREVRVVGRLDDVETRATSYVVSPFVGHLVGASRPAAHDPLEVARVIDVSVLDVLAADARIPPDAGVARLRYPLHGEDVWGATARILRGFAHVVRAALAAGAERGGSPS